MADAAEIRESSPAEHATAEIRDCIVRGEYRAGQRVVEEDLATAHGVSRTTVREALRVLASQGFVSVQPYFGTFVAEMTADEARDLLEVQGALEPLAAGLAAQRRTPAQIAELRAIVDAGRAAASLGRSGDTSGMHGRFHRVLATASGNETLVGVLVALHHKLDWAYTSSAPRPPGDSWDEHALMVDAIERRDRDAAIKAARAHIEHGVDAVRERQD